MTRTAAIVVIGDEILSGKIADKNAALLIRELRELGVELRSVEIVRDEVAAIAGAVERARGCDIVFTSGGVGPTHDDLTMDGVARAFGVKVVRDATLVGLLEGFYGGPLTRAQKRLAEVPDGADIVRAEGDGVPTGRTPWSTGSWGSGTRPRSGGGC